jgi:hypothetical protein
MVDEIEKRDARVAAEVPQLPLVRESGKDDLLTIEPTEAAVTCCPPSSLSVTTWATVSLLSRRGRPGGGGFQPRIDASGRLRRVCESPVLSTSCCCCLPWIDM